MFSSNKVSEEELQNSIHKCDFTVLPDGRTTICTLTLFTGFTVRGESSCVSKENFDVDKGRKYSYAQAVNKVWPVLGAMLSFKLWQEGTADTVSWQERLQQEYAVLRDRLAKLEQFRLWEPAFLALPVKDQELLTQQSNALSVYLGTLEARLKRVAVKG